MEIQNVEVETERIEVISFKRLIRPISKCLFVILVLSVSTGSLIRELVLLTISDLFALTIGFLWLLGDIIPCVALFATFYDLLLTGKEDETCLLVQDSIFVLFIALYLIELLIVFKNYAKHQESDLLVSYRYNFFNFQILISILYLTKPWAWKNLDLRNIVVSLGRFHLLLYRMAESISVYLQVFRLDPMAHDIVDVPERQLERVPFSSRATKAIKKIRRSLIKVRKSVPKARQSVLKAGKLIIKAKNSVRKTRKSIKKARTNAKSTRRGRGNQARKRRVKGQGQKCTAFARMHIAFDT